MLFNIYIKGKKNALYKYYENLFEDFFFILLSLFAYNIFLLNTIFFLFIIYLSINLLYIN